MPLSYPCLASNLAKLKITATLQQHDQHPGPKQLQLDSCRLLGFANNASDRRGVCMCEAALASRDDHHLLTDTNLTERFIS